MPRRWQGTQQKIAPLLVEMGIGPPHHSHHRPALASSRAAAIAALLDAVLHFLLQYIASARLRSGIGPPQNSHSRSIIAGIC
jgi:hypothetical protein